MAERNPLAESQTVNTTDNLGETLSKNEAETYTSTSEDGNKENPIKSRSARKSILKVFDPLYLGSPLKKSSVTPENLEFIGEEESRLNLVNQGSDETFTFDTFKDTTFPLEETISTTYIAPNEDICNSTFNLAQTENSETSVEPSNQSFICDILGDLLSQLQLNDSEESEILLENNEDSVSDQENISAIASPILFNIDSEEYICQNSTTVVTKDASVNNISNNTEGFEQNIVDNLVDADDNNHKETKVISITNDNKDSIEDSLECASLSVQPQIYDLDVIKKIIESKEFDKLKIVCENLEKPHQLFGKAMSDLTDMMNLQEQDICDLKLQLNQSQQARASLELQVRQKEEILIKTQVEAQKKEQEIRQLHEKLNAKDELPSQDTRLRELETAFTEAKAKQEQLQSILQVKSSEGSEFICALGEYEKQFKLKLEDLERVKNEYSTAKRHLANVEMAFSDVHQKYERSKIVIEGYKRNEITLCEDVRQYQDAIKKQDERYDTLKAHAKAQIDKCNFEIRTTKDSYDMEITKLNAIVKRLQIKLESVTNLLNQKTKECEGLAELCDEVTGKINSGVFNH